MRHLGVVGLVLVLVPAHAWAAPPAPIEMWDEPEAIKPEPEPEPPSQLRVADAELRVIREPFRRPPNNFHGHWRLAAGIGVRWGTFLVDNVDTGTNTQGHAEL